MADKSKIEWTDASWTPIRARVRADAANIAVAKGYASLVEIAREMAGRVGPHCEHASPGCNHCYSETNNGRCLPVNGTGLPFDRRSRDLVEIFLDKRILLQPLAWRPSKWIFVCSQTDLFGEFVPDEMIDRVFAVMALAGWHHFQVLTKRADRLRQYFADLARRERAVALASRSINITGPFQGSGKAEDPSVTLPLKNVMLGVSVEDRARLGRIEHLLETPAKFRFASLEPLLEDLGDITPALFRSCSAFGHQVKRDGWACSTCQGPLRERLDWIIVGGESGRRARPCDPAWVRSIKDQCVGAAVPFFFKQWGEWMPVENLPPTDTRAGGLRTRPPAVRVGKKAAGRLLDGRTWDEMPDLSDQP